MNWRKAISRMPKGVGHRPDDLESHRQPELHRPSVGSHNCIELHAEIAEVSCLLDDEFSEPAANAMSTRFRQNHPTCVADVITEASCIRCQEGGANDHSVLFGDVDGPTIGTGLHPDRPRLGFGRVWRIPIGVPEATTLRKICQISDQSHDSLVRNGTPLLLVVGTMSLHPQPHLCMLDGGSEGGLLEGDRRDCDPSHGVQDLIQSLVLNWREEYQPLNLQDLADRRPKTT